DAAHLPAQLPRRRGPRGARRPHLVRAQPGLPPSRLRARAHRDGAPGVVRGGRGADGEGRLTRLSFPRDAGRMPRRWLQQFEGVAARIGTDLETLVRMESPSDDAQRVSAVATWVRDRLRERGVAAEIRPCPPRGEAVLATVGGRDNATLVLGHCDTVWPAGTLATFPFRVQGERATGPGVFDMKAGIAGAMAVLAAAANEPRPPAG